MTTRHALVALLLLASSCLSGCLAPGDVRKLVGFTDPSVKIIKGEKEWTFVTSTDFKGRGKVDVHADGSYSFDVKMTSDASDVTEAQGLRADIAHLLEIRQDESTRIMKTQQQLFGLMNSIMQAAIPLLARPPSVPEPPTDAPIVLPPPGP